MWEKRLLGDKLLDTLVFYVGLYFALRSGTEHRRLQFYPSQIQLYEPINGRAYLVYTEDVSKTNQGDVAHPRCERKQVTHYANDLNPQHYLVRLYKLYMSRCPMNHPDGTFYPKPLSKPTEKCWYQIIPVGHNRLQQTVCPLCESAGFNGHFTNHSFRATSATRLFEANRRTAYHAKNRTHI